MRTALFLAVLLMAGPVLAQEGAETGGSAELSADTGMMTTGDTGNGDRPGPLIIGAEVGAIFPQPFTELGTHVAFGIELGYRLPFVEERIEVMFAAGFSPPNNNFDDRREEGKYEAELDQQMLTFSLGPRFRFLPVESEFNINAALGGRLFLLRTYSNGSRGGQQFMEFTEESTQFGFFVALGGEYRLGPGALFLDIDLGYSNLPHKITGDASTGNITPTLGYRIFLL